MSSEKPKDKLHSHRSIGVHPALAMGGAISVFAHKVKMGCLITLTAVTAAGTAAGVIALAGDGCNPEKPEAKSSSQE